MMGREGRTEAEPEVCVGDVGGHGEVVRLCRWCVGARAECMVVFVVSHGWVL